MFLKLITLPLLLTLFVGCSVNEDPTLNKTPNKGTPDKPTPPEKPTTPEQILKYAHIPEQAHLSLYSLTQAKMIMDFAENLNNDKSAGYCFRTMDKQISNNIKKFYLKTLNTGPNNKCRDPRTVMIPSQFQMILHTDSNGDYTKIQFTNLDKNDKYNSLRSYTYLNNVYSVEFLQTLLNIEIERKSSNTFLLNAQISKELMSQKKLNENTVTVKAQGRLDYETTAELINDDNRWYIKNLNIEASHILNDTYRNIETHTQITSQSNQVHKINKLFFPQGELNIKHTYQYKEKSHITVDNKLEIIEAHVVSKINNDSYREPQSSMTYDFHITREAQAIISLQDDIFSVRVQ